MNEVIKRKEVQDLFLLKVKILRRLDDLKQLDEKIENLFKEVNSYEPYRIDYRFDNYEDNREEKYVDRTMWRYLISLYHLEKYMLCTEYEKMRNEIEEFKTPDFTVENAEGWLAGLRGMIYENVRLMCKRVYDELINGTYRTGNNWNAPKKKRNNAGVDNWFILSTGDYRRIYGYWMNRPTVTDDLEKVCYLLDGKTLPDKTVIDLAKINEAQEVECPYFTVRFCKNGNTHYKLTDETRERLNRIGPDGNMIGEKIRIKIFDDRR